MLGRERGKGWHTGELGYSVSLNKVGSWGTDTRDPRMAARRGHCLGSGSSQQQTPAVSCRNQRLPHEYFNEQLAKPESTQCHLTWSGTPGNHTYTQQEPVSAGSTL